jgi:bifunctional NMN adenylyltransferase/nudix hydrolase
MSAPFALGVFVGPFHVLRLADLAVLGQLLDRAPRCLVLVGSAHVARSIGTPFTWQERAEVIRRALPPAAAARVVLQPLRERYDVLRTAQDVTAAATAHLPEGGGAVLLARDGEGLQFPIPEGWTLLRQEPADDSAETLRDRVLAAEAPERVLNEIAPQLPDAARHFLERWQGTPEHEQMHQEWLQIAAEKKAWSVAPYPVVLVTVDAVVRCGAHVLLIRRGRAPGKGLRALPGGFLDPRETVLQAAIRELVEETQIDVPEADVRAALRGVRVFDHPRRSQRGRVITHAHHFDLGDRPLPRVLGSDDAAHAEWVAIDQLPAMEPQLLDDHFHVLAHFLGLPLP